MSDELDDQSNLSQRDIQLIEAVVRGVVSQSKILARGRYPDRPAKASKFNMSVAIVVHDFGYVSERDAIKILHEQHIAKIIKLAVEGLYPAFESVTVEVKKKFNGSEYLNGE